MDLSVILPVMNECENLRILVPRLSALLKRMGLSFEIVVVDGGSTDGTQQASSKMGARVVAERRRGYAGALTTGFAEARGDYLLTLDADLSHEPDFVARMWRARERADIVIASRYVRGAVAYTAWSRRVLSRLLNLAMRRVLSMPVRDMSSGFRLYRREVIEGLELQSLHFEILEEVLVKAYVRGCSVTEVPFTYFPRGEGRSHARLLRFGWDLTRAAAHLWKLRNSRESADYEERAFYSAIPPQRYWHRRRHRITTSWARGGARTLDLGCGSSVIIQSLTGAIGLDLNFARLRFLSRFGFPLVRAGALALPFRAASFDCLVCSNVIEHLPPDERMFQEMRRVLRPGGMLVIGTPDCASPFWRVIEPIYKFVLPGGYGKSRGARYTRATLSAALKRHGFAVEQTAYIARSELIMRCRRDGAAGLSAPEPEKTAASSAA